MIDSDNFLAGATSAVPTPVSVGAMLNSVSCGWIPYLGINSSSDIVTVIIERPAGDAYSVSCNSLADAIADKSEPTSKCLQPTKIVVATRHNNVK